MKYISGRIFQSSLFIVLYILFTVPVLAQKSDIVVIIEKVRSNKGVVRITLFTKQVDYMKNFSMGKIVNAKTGSVSATFENMPAGEYAITATHDENNNGKLDSNFFGIPKEGVGFSNDASATFGPPSWGKAKFKLSLDSKPLTINLKYF